jgi:predicted AAA+ superfamily ATPase
MESELLARIAAALERLAPPALAAPSPEGADAFVWHPAPARLQAVVEVARVPIALLQGLDRQKTLLLENTARFAAGLPANNAMLWGARGMGKSSLVKAAHAACAPGSVALIEIVREDIASLPALLDVLRQSPRRCLVFCDDLSFEREDADYKALKSVLDGGIAGRPGNVLFYATSNRRHLMPREMIDNERATAIHGGEATDEKVSLSDRFGLWLGFHHCDQPTYLAIVEGYALAYGLAVEAPALNAQAIEWAVTRGSRSGRVAAQFIDDLAGRLGVTLGARGDA